MLVLITDLPDAALQRVVELASTPSTPGPCLLSGVSRGFRRASASVRDGTIIHLHFGERAATLLEAFPDHPPAEPCSWPVCQAGQGHLCLWRPEQRLLGLAQWLAKYASQVVSLCISYSTCIDPYWRYGDMAVRYHERQAQADAVTALAASLREAAAHMPSSSGGSSSSSVGRGASVKQPPSLPLQQLRLPAARGLTNISNTLAVCGGLRQLRLDAIFADNGTRLGYQALCQALCGLTQLTALQLSDVWAEVGQPDTLDPLFSSCPSSLEVLLVKVNGVNTLSTSSMTHLGRLRQLELSSHLVTVDEVEGQQQLTGLTCLTCLDWGPCQEGGRAMVDLPQLRVFSSNLGPGQYLEQLVGKTSFGKLALAGGSTDAAEVAVLAQLTQLTELVVRTWTSPTPAAAWCAAFGALSQLQCLTISWGHWRDLVEAAAPVCKQLAHLRHLTLAYINNVSDPQGAADVVQQLQLLGQLQQLTLGSRKEAAAQCVAAAAVQALPCVEVRVVVTCTAGGPRCKAACCCCSKFIEDLLE